MLAFLKKLIRRNNRKIDELRAEFDDLRKQRDEWIRRHNGMLDKCEGLERVIENLSSAQEYDRNISGAISRETYEARVVKHIGNTTVTQQDTAHTTAFKLGVQHAMRQFEKECVV